MEEKKRPTGLTIISILWFLGSLINLYYSFNTISIDLQALSYLPDIHPYFSFAVPVELGLAIITLILGIVQIITIYGLWIGKSWSYKPALAIPIISLASAIVTMVLYSSAPPGYGIVEAIDYGFLGIALAFALIYWFYLRQPHVKEYLGVTTPQPSTSPITAPSTSFDKFCPYCGAKIKAEFQFCSNCGKKYPE